MFSSKHSLVTLPVRASGPNISSVDCGPQLTLSSSFSPQNLLAILVSLSSFNFAVLWPHRLTLAPHSPHSGLHLLSLPSLWFPAVPSLSRLLPSLRVRASELGGAGVTPGGRGAGLVAGGGELQRDLVLVAEGGA